MDPLYVLRDHVMNKKPIHTDGNDIVFQNARFPKTTQTIFLNRATKEKFTLEALFFAHQHAESPRSVYVEACNKAGIKLVSFTDNQSLQAFLRGETDSSPCIDVSAITPAATPAPQVSEEERQAKRQKREDLQTIESYSIPMDESLLEEKEQNAKRLVAPKTSFSVAGGDTTYAENQSYHEYHRF